MKTKKPSLPLPAVKSSHGACRSAKQLERYLIGPACSTAKAAAIIDRETKLPELTNVLTRLAEKVRRANSIQHSGGRIEADDWAELYQLQNEAFAFLADVSVN